MLRLNRVDGDHARIAAGQFESAQHLGEHLRRREGAQHRGDVADGDAAAGIGRRRSAAQARAHPRLRLVQGAAGGSHAVVQAGSQHRFASAIEISAPGEVLAQIHHRPEDFDHQFQVLLVLSRGARGDFGKEVAHVRLSDRQEFQKAVEEMVVRGFRAGLEVAHGECVHHLAVEHGIAERGAGGRARLGIARWRAQRHRLAVHAEAVVGGILDEALGVNRAHQVVVQVATLGHVVKKRVQQQRLMPHRFQVARGALFGCLHLGCGRQREKKYEYNATESSAHEAPRCVFVNCGIVNQA